MRPPPSCATLFRGSRRSEAPPSTKVSALTLGAQAHRPMGTIATPASRGRLDVEAKARARDQYYTPLYSPLLYAPRMLGAARRVSSNLSAVCRRSDGDEHLHAMCSYRRLYSYGFECSYTYVHLPEARAVIATH
jgi:hypothetical protein